MINILLCDQNQKWLENFVTKLTDNMNLVDAVDNGKKAQEVVCSNKIDAIIINLNTKNYSFFEVVKFIKQKMPKILILMVVENKKDLDEYFYNEKEIKKLGIAKTYIKPFPVYHLVKYIEDSFKHKQWSDALNSKNDNLLDDRKELSESDHNFTSLGIDQFQNNNISIFDLFIRMKKNKYLKVFRASETIDFDRLKKYLEKEPELRLFFKVSDRLSYINFTNELIKRNLDKKSTSSIEMVKMVDTSTQMLVEEVYTSGLPEHVIEESVSVCKNIYNSIDRNKNLKQLLDTFFVDNDSEEAHISLTAFYTAIICKNIDWVSSHSRDNIIMGAVLHDLGKLKLSKIIKNKKIDELDSKGKIEFEKHCEYGLDLLDEIEGISEQVKQIVYQHHELNSGEGYPNKLTSSKIYPLAKIVAFSNFLSNKSIELKASPLETIKKIMEEKTDIMKYEPFVIKAFIRGFVEDV